MEYDEYIKERLNWNIKETLSIGELIDILNNYPKEMKVIITWESLTTTLTKENIYLSKWNTLFLDADGNFYKEDFAKDPKED